MKVTDEQKERANLVNLPQFLMAHGFDLKKVGREYVWKEHDSLHIRDNGPGERGQWFRFSENKGGDNIGFLREYMGMSFAEAVKALTGERIDRSYTPSHTYQPKPVQQTAREISLVEADNARRVFAYLCKTRGLDYDLVSALVRSGAISQEEKTGNVLFKYYDTDGKVIGAEKVGTSTEHKFKGIATGSAGGHGFEICRGNGSDLLFFESAIDMLSYLQMHSAELTDHRLVSMMGVKPNIVLETMRRYNISPDHVFLCSDNDTAGNEFADRLMQEYPEMQRIITPDTYKDWNDMLRGIPKEVEQEKKKEADSVAIQTYGNKMWNDATDNRDKSLLTISVNDFPKLQEQLEQSGINYFGYVRGESVIMAVGDKDMEWFRQIAGTPDLMPTKSNRPYSPPEKNIFGSAEYRYIPQKEYFTADRDLVLKMAEIMAKRGMQFSGRVYPSGKGTLTVSHADLFAVRNIRDEVVNMRRQFASPDKAEEVGTRSYRANRDTYYYMSKLTPEQFKEVKPFLETGVSYHAVSRDGKVAFALDKENAPAFHRALENAVREVSMLHSMSALGLSTEQTVALSPVVHRLAMEDMQLNLGDFFDQRYDDAQFGEMLSLVNAYLSQSPAERFGEHSKLNDMLEAKSSFDRSIELSDFFSQHDFSDEQRAAITAMFVGDVTRGQIASIDETFTPADIQAYDEILHNALQESDITDFLSAHAKDVTLAEAYATHKDMQLSGSDDELANFRLHYDPEINGGEGGYNLIADRTAEPFIRDMSISVLSDDISFDTFKNFLASHDLSFDRVVDTIVPEKQPTEEEVLFGQADLAMFLASGTLSSDEWEDMAYPLFEDGYLDKHKPNDKAAYGYHLSEPEFYDLAHRYHDGEDIRAELALALMEHKQSDDIEFVFEEGEISNRTFYYAENLRYTLHAEYGGDTVKLSFGGMEREVSYSEIGQAFLDKIQEEYTDIVHFRTMDELAEVLPTFTEDMHSKLIDAFDGAAMHGWEQGDNQAKINRIKKALHEILGDEEQTEKAFAAIAKEKYHVSFEPEKREDSLTFRFGNDHSEWISESGLLSDYVEAHPNMSFALGNAVAEYLDEKQHTERSNPELKAGWYKKTDFMLRAVINGEESGYEGRFDIGDGKGMGGGSLIDHIRDRAEGIIKSDQYPYNQDSYKAEAQHTLDVLVPFLEKHSELTIEEQQILADFKAQNPIRSEAEKKMAHGTFEIYQMKSGEQYHYNRFESLERNKDADLTMADYDLVYSGDLSDYPAEGTLDAIYTKFNVDHPEDFRGHSLSMSDVIVTEVDGEKKAFYCDDIGFTEFPDFFKEKELVQEQAQKPTVADLAVGDIIMFDGSRREVEAISADSIKLRDLDAPDYGGVLLSTSDVYSYDGWQQQMNEKGFEILSKAEKPDLGPVTMRKVGDFYEMYGKNAEIGAEVLGLQMFTKRGEPMVGFPDHIKSEYADKLRDAGYTVLEEQAFELNPPKREEEKLVSLQDVVDVYFGTDCESAETENGTWKLSIAEGDKVGKLFYAGDAVCGIYNRGDHMEIEPYRELTTFPKLLQAAMLEHNPDKPVEIAEFQRVFDTPLDKAKFLINEFCEAEYRDGADFSDLHNVSLAYTTLTDDELPIQVTADLVDHTISYDFDGEVFSVERYDSIEDMIDNALTGLDFTELVSVPESVIEKHIGKDEPEQAVPEEAADIDAPLFSDADVIDQIQKDEHSDVPFWEMPAVEGEQLSLFGDPEPVRSTRTEKPKPEFAAGPIVDGVQVYEALAAEIDRGTGFVNGKLRVQEFYDEQHPTVQQLADFLKKEYGTGGHSGEGKISLVSTDSKGMTFDFSNGEKYRHSWFNVAVMTESRLRDNTYLSAEQKAEMDARKTAKASPSIVEVGERFRHKITGDISEVISLTGALPFYSDDCTITTDKGSYATTENISYDKLLNSGLYEYIGKAEPEKSQQTAETVKEDAPAIATEPEKPEIPAVKNLSQLKKAIQPGMMFEITDHSRPECVGERRIVTGVTTVDFTSKKLDENGEPTGKDLHMDFDRAKNWSFDGGEMTSHLEDGSVLMSFHFIDSLEREKPAPIKTEHIPVYTGEWPIMDNKALFREIVAENERFAAMAKEVIGNGRNPADSVKALVDEFGMERTAFLTALNIVAHPGDGRFYPADKEWACLVLTPYLEVKPDEVISNDPEKQRLFEHMIGGGPLYSIHNTHLAQFAETLIPEYEKYLEQTRSAEKDAAESTLSPVGSKSEENAAPDLLVGDHVEYKGKEYHVESIEQGGFITLCEAGREDMPHIMSRVTFLTDEFLSSGDFTVVAAKTVDAPEKGDNFTITDDALGEGGVKAKFRANVDAIRTLKTLEKEKRPATAEEKETLSKYVGWGSLAKAFDKNDPKWAAEYQELSELLSPEEYRQARASVNDAFYTSPTIIDGIYEALGNFGFDGGAVLEPAMGIGNFFGRMPAEMQENSQLYGVEIDSISGRIAKALYPDADIAIQGFEKNSFQNGCFDVAVGNVPFGELGFRDTVHDTTKLHDFFFAEALDNVSVNYG